MTDTPEAIVPESPAARLRWVDLDAAIAETVEPNLLAFLARIAVCLGR